MKGKRGEHWRRSGEEGWLSNFFLLKYVQLRYLYLCYPATSSILSICVGFSILLVPDRLA